VGSGNLEHTVCQRGNDKAELNPSPSGSN
jgi:hypothetical protein